MSNYLRDEGCIRLIQCFLQPDLMLEHSENPNPLTEEKVFELGPDNTPRVRQHEEVHSDPVYQLFMASNLGMYITCVHVCQFMHLCTVALNKMFLYYSKGNFEHSC